MLGCFDVCLMNLSLCLTLAHMLFGGSYGNYEPINPNPIERSPDMWDMAAAYEPYTPL